DRSLPPARCPLFPYTTLFRSVQPLHGFVEDRAHRSQWMIGWYEGVQMHGGKQGFVSSVGSTHDQWLPLGIVPGIVLLPVFAGVVFNSLLVYYIGTSMFSHMSEVWKQLMDISKGYTCLRTLIPVLWR